MQSTRDQLESTRSGKLQLESLLESTHLTGVDSRCDSALESTRALHLVGLVIESVEHQRLFDTERLGASGR